jgi:hypothetical protein
MGIKVVKSKKEMKLWFEKHSFYMPIAKRGQVTIFIIIGILIAAAIIVVFFYSNRIGFTSSPADNPEAYLKNCIMASIKQSEVLLLKSNGYPQFNSNNFVLYNSEKIPYMCTVSQFYTACIPQEPAFFNYARKLLENKVALDAEGCTSALITDLKSKNFEVTQDPGQTNLTIQKDAIYVKLSKKIYASRAEDSLGISGVDISYGTNLYGMLKLEQTIINSESTLCTFQSMEWMKIDPSIIISKTMTSDQTKIYTLKDRLTDRQIKFAIKTCVLPAGL